MCGRHITCDVKGNCCLAFSSAGKKEGLKFIRIMKAYGIDKKLRTNLTDCHPKKLGKNIVNWWEVTLKSYSKKRARQSAKLEINKILNKEGF